MAAVVFGFRSAGTVLHALDARVKLAALVFVSMACLHAAAAPDLYHRRRLVSSMKARCYGAERTIPCRPVTARE